MFNLENAVSEWRKRMLAAGVKQRTSLDELEEHLRSDVEQQTRSSGIDTEAAFSNAVARIGAPTQVRDEFRKARPRIGAAFEPLMSAGATLLIVSTLGFCALAFSILHIDIVQQIVGLVGVSFILFVACSWRRLIAHVPVAKNLSTRFCLYVLCFALAFVCPAGLAWLVERWLDPSSNAYVIAIIWAASPMPVLICLAQSFMMDRNDREKWGMISATSNHKERYV
jgi:hypothetical protein